MKVSCRYILAVMGSLGVMNVYFCRINLSVALVAMVGVANNSNSDDSVVEHCEGDVCKRAEVKPSPANNFLSLCSSVD